MVPARKNEKSEVGEDFAEIRGYIADIRGSIAGIHEKLGLLDLIAQKILGEDADKKVENVKKQPEVETLASEDSKQFVSHDDGFLKNIDPIVGQIQPITKPEKKTHHSNLNYKMVMYEHYDPQTQRRETPFSLLDGENAGSKDRTAEPYFERGKDMVDDLFGFAKETTNEEHQQRKENGLETEIDKCVYQVLDQMSGQGKRVTKKRKRKRWKNIAKGNDKPYGRSERCRKVEEIMLKNRAQRLKYSRWECAVGRKRSRQELGFVEQLGGHKTVVKKPARWKKHKFKQKFNKKRERIKLRGFIMLTRKKLAAKENRYTYCESLEKPLRCQRDRRKRRVTYGQFMRCKFEPGGRDHLNFLFQMKKDVKGVSMRRMKRCNTVKCYCIWLKELLLFEIRVKKRKSQSGHNAGCRLTLDDMRLLRIKSAATKKSFSGKWRKGKKFRDKLKNKQLKDKMLLSLHLRDITDQSLRSKKLLRETKYGGENNKCNCLYMMLLLKRLILESEEQSVVMKPSDGSHVDALTSLLVTYVITWDALEGNNQGPGWSDSDWETQAWECLVIVLELTCLSGEDIVCWLGSVFYWEGQAEEALDFGTTAGQAGGGFSNTNNITKKKVKIVRNFCALAVQMFEIQNIEHVWHLRSSEHSDFWVVADSEVSVRQANCLDEWSHLETGNGVFLKTLQHHQLFLTDKLKEKAPPWFYGTFEVKAKLGEVTYGFSLTADSKLSDVGLLMDKQEAVFSKQEEIKENKSQFCSPTLKTRLNSNGAVLIRVTQHLAQ